MNFKYRISYLITFRLLFYFKKKKKKVKKIVRKKKVLSAYRTHNGFSTSLKVLLFTAIFFSLSPPL